MECTNNIKFGQDAWHWYNNGCNNNSKKSSKTQQVNKFILAIAIL